MPSRLLLRRIFVAPSVVICGVLIFTKYKDLPLVASQWSIEGQPAAANITSITRPRRPIKIGEDCNDAETKCQYFRPVQFVSEWKQTYPTSDIKRPAKLQKQSRRTARMASLNRCYKNMIALYYMRCNNNSITDNRCQAVRSFQGDTENSTFVELPIQFAYKKMYKTGGTAIDEVLRRTFYHDNKRNMRLGMVRPLSPSANMTRAHSFMEQVAHDQSRGIDYPVIAVVRDPIQRFVSAVNQLLGMGGRMRKCKQQDGYRMNNTKQAMECAVAALVNRYKDPHLESMVADMNCNVGGRHDVQFSLYPMDDVPELLRALGSNNSTEKINSSGEKGFVVTVSDMDNEMMRKVCRWYAADVAMMISLGFSVSYCSTESI